MARSSKSKSGGRKGGGGGGKARTYKRDSNGRFASTGGSTGASSPSKKAAPKKAAAKTAAPARSGRASSPRGMDGPQRRTKASVVSTSNAMARLSEGRRLKGKGNNPTTRAERNLERGLVGTGKKARKSEATAKRAIDYMASKGTLGKRSNGTKKRK
jgi:hypothetical protein